ncbi:hypothetical protein PG997_008995 [Apiospora hydei]|uniref:NACHT domain-containing protein n=1 Tax=Apiospora hydei TaxID=1337664 RepID=A0ABR1WCL9_9PEZI
MATAECLPRPRTTKELLGRLRDIGSHSGNDAEDRRPQNQEEQDSTSDGLPSARCKKEAEALSALSRRMTQIFIENPKDLYANVTEAAALAPFVRLEEFPGFFNAFVQAIASGSGDHAVPNINVLEGFNAVLHCPQALQCTQHEDLRTQLSLGHAVLGLKNRLTTAGLAADLETQYRLLRTLCAILDAMNEVKFGGISEYDVVEPLIKELQKSSGHSELRIAQAARYASESLRGIPSDVSPWKKLGESMIKTLGVAANVSGSVATLDPAKLLEGLLDAPGAAEGLVKGAIDNPEFTLSKDKDFLCGLCSQLEQAAHEGGQDSPVVLVLKDFLLLKGGMSSSRRVQAWMQLTVPTAGLPKPSLGHRLNSKFGGLFGASTFGTSVGYSKVAVGRLGDASRLLRAAWETCPEANLFYADQVVRDFYTNKDLGLLNVERLDPTKCLPMAQCYINMAIVEGSAGSAPPLGSLRRRLDVWEVDKEHSVTLPSLFQPKDSKAPAPKRVLIRGKAGVGKCTLCKRVVYDSIHHDLWADIVDRVIWLPLRELKGRDKWDYDLRQLLRERFYRGVEDGELLASALHGETTGEQSRTLFVLDGLDEMQGETSNLLRILLGQPRVIVTSRPQGVNRNLIGNIHREVETLGFYHDQVKQYTATVSPEQSERIQVFLDTHPAIEGLMRIPVQLDAFCYSFETDAFAIDRTPQTMTELYRAIEQVIWKKDVVQLETKPPPQLEPDVPVRGPPFHPVRDQGARAGQDERVAGARLCRDGQQHGGIRHQVHGQLLGRRERRVDQMPPAQAEMPKFGELDRLSFLRTSGQSSSASSNYHFLHLTYQEYFAAQYFVHHWPHKQLPGIGMTAEAFLRREKYNPRYDIVWRFVAGLLQMKGTAASFFETIQEGPCDLLGQAHQRLVMRCLAEIHHDSDLGGLRASLEHCLRQWFLHANPDGCNSSMAKEMEFPEKVLLDCLPGASEALRRILVEILKDRPRMLPQTVECCAAPFKMEGGEDSPLSKLEALEILVAHYIPNNLVPEVASLGSRVRKLPTLPPGIVRKLVEVLKDPDYHTWEAAAWVLQRTPVRLEILPELLAVLRHPGLSDERVVGEVLWQAEILPRSFLRGVLDVLKGPQSTNRDAAAQVLSIQGLELPSDILQEIGALLDDPEPEKRGAAMKSLTRQPSLPAEILRKVLNQWQKDGPNFAEDILQRQTVLPEDILGSLVDLLKAEPDVRRAAACVLSEQSSLPDNIVDRITTLLLDDAHQDGEIASCAAFALPRPTPLTSGVLHKTIALGLGGDRGRYRAAVYAVGVQPTLPADILPGILALLESTSENVWQETGR